jgi:hypothetical protein
MTPISKNEFSEFLSGRAINRAPTELGIGAHLSSDAHQKRIVTIHFLEDEPSEYVSQVLRIFLRLESTWIVFPRYGGLEEIFRNPGLACAEAVEIGQEEVESLIEAMMSVQQSNLVIETDPYVLAASGEIYTPWDHHVYADGFNVLFSNVEKSTRFITALNELGAEFDVYYANA